MTSDWTTWLLFALIIALLVWNITRRRKTGNTNLDAVMAVLANVDSDLKIVEARMSDPQSKKKFQTSAWKSYKEKLTFLDANTTSALNTAFNMAEEFNSRIDVARKSNSLATLQDMPVEKLKAPLTTGKEGLVAWLKRSVDTEQQSNRGCRGF